MKVEDTAETTIGRYEIIRTLGKGAMGVVYQARDPALDRIVAIKTIVAPRSGKRMHTAYIERFKREAQAAAKMQHPSIVTIFDVGIENDAPPYMVLEYLPGDSLADRLDRVRLRLGRAVQIGLDLASALSFAHRQRIVHRDVKPANVLHAGENRWKLADFGIARMPDSDLTQVGVFMGTPGYSPPEAIKFGHYTPQADVFAWGAVLYEMLSGRIPYEGPDTRTTNGYVIKATAQSPRHYDPSIPEPLAEVIMTALNPSVTERYKDGAAAEKALREAWELCLTMNMIPGLCMVGDDLPHDQVQGQMHQGTIVNVPAQARPEPAEASMQASPVLVIESRTGRISDDAPTQILKREGDDLRAIKESGAMAAMSGSGAVRAAHITGQGTGQVPGHVTDQASASHGVVSPGGAPMVGSGAVRTSAAMPVSPSGAIPVAIQTGPGTESRPAMRDSVARDARNGTTSSIPTQSGVHGTGLPPRALFWAAIAVMLLTAAAVLVHVLTR
jgi:serine/threonine-protein kinase